MVRTEYILAVQGYDDPAVIVSNRYARRNETITIRSADDEDHYVIVDHSLVDELCACLKKSRDEIQASE